MGLQKLRGGLTHVPPALDLPRALAQVVGTAAPSRTGENATANPQLNPEFEGVLQTTPFEQGPAVGATASIRSQSQNSGWAAILVMTGAKAAKHRIAIAFLAGF